MVGFARADSRRDGGERVSVLELQRATELDTVDERSATVCATVYAPTSSGRCWRGCHHQLSPVRSPSFSFTSFLHPHTPLHARHVLYSRQFSLPMRLSILFPPINSSLACTNLCRCTGLQ